MEPAMHDVRSHPMMTFAYSLIPLLIVASLVPTISWAHSFRNSGADAVLRASLQAMDHNLHTVHAEMTGFSGPPTGGRPRPMTVRGDCSVSPQQTVVRFMITGWRMVQTGPGQAQPERIDETFITLADKGKSQKIWERSARTHGRWQRSDSNDDALVGTLMCPSSRTFLFGCLNQKCTRAGVVIPPNLGNLGTRSLRGLPTIYLHSVQVTRDHDAGGKPIRSTMIQDFFIARDSHFLTRLVQSGTVQSGAKTTFASSTTVNYSRFNETVRIAVPHN